MNTKRIFLYEKYKKAILFSNLNCERKKNIKYLPSYIQLTHTHTFPKRTSRIPQFLSEQTLENAIKPIRAYAHTSHTEKLYDSILTYSNKTRTYHFCVLTNNGTSVRNVECFITQQLLLITLL